MLGYNYHGRPITKTCKSKTVKDFIWISPEMVPYFRSVETIDDLFPDHSVLFAKFSSWGTQEKIPLWRKPKPIDWDKVQMPIHEHSPSSYRNESRLEAVTTDEAILQIAKEFEDRVNQAQIKKNRPQPFVTATRPFVHSKTNRS